jgi:hypothetical protein
VLTEIPLLLPLLPKQIPENWKYIQTGIRESVLDGKVITDKELTNILEGLLLRRMQCWFGGMSGETKEHQLVFDYYMMAVTTLINGNMMILGLVKYKPITKELGLALLEQLKVIAKAWGCKMITTVTTQRDLVEIVKDIGGNADFTVLSMEV